MQLASVDHVWLALWLPLIGFGWCVLFGQLWPRLAGWVASIAVGLAFLVAIGAFLGLLALAPSDRSRVGDLYTWIASAGPTGFVAPFRILLDPLSAVMLLVVTGVSFLIHVYATGYMRQEVPTLHAEVLDPRYGTFFAYMNLFVFSMVLLVLAGNFLLLMVGWAGVGLCSYLLISFWFEIPANAAAGVKAFVVNAIGDAGLILGSSLILIHFRTLDYVEVFRNAPNTLPSGGGEANGIALLLLVAAVAKSAQLPLYVWLPDAMAGPTPVSALIHAATMVTAGVYLIARASPLFTLSPLTMAIIAWIGAITALFAATIGLVKLNIKRVLAYSTVSQLGYMFLAVGVGGFTAGIFHLMTHAFFKALLFLGAGAVIHALGGEEDMRLMGGLKDRLPVVFWTFLVASAAISGVPLFSGFFSKDEIITLAFVSPSGNVILGLIALVTAGLTAVYIFRAVFMTFFGPSRVPPELANHLHPPGSSMVVPLVVLAALSFLGGYVQIFPLDGFASFLEPAFRNSNYTVPLVTQTGLNPAIAILSAVFALGGIAIAWAIWYRSPATAESLARQFASIREVLLNDYGIDAAYNAVFVGAVRGVGRLAAFVVDPQVIDGIVNFFPRAIGWSSGGIASLETGYVRSYATWILVGALLVVLAFVLRGGI